MRRLGVAMVAILGLSSVARADDEPAPPPEPDATTPGPPTLPEAATAPAPTPAQETDNDEDEDDDEPAKAIRPPSAVAPIQAEAPPAPVVRAPLISPFSSMFHQDGTKKVDIDMSSIGLKGDNVSVPDRMVRVDLYGQYVSSSSHVGAYASIPALYAAMGEQNDTTIGGLEIGIIYLPTLSSPDLGIVLHAGAVIPTGSKRDMMFNGAGMVGRVTEFYASTPDAGAFRIGVSPIFHSPGGFWLRIDIGIDKSGSANSVTPNDTAFLFGAGVGVETEHAVFAADMTNLVLTTADDSSSSTTVTVGSLSARFGAGKIKPYIAFEVPISSGDSNIMSYGLTIGVTAIP